MLIITLHGQTDYFNMQRFFKISCIKKYVFFKKTYLFKAMCCIPGCIAPERLFNTKFKIFTTTLALRWDFRETCQEQ